MTSYDDYFPSNFFKADDLDDGNMPLTITDIHAEKMQDGKSKPCVFFKEDKRALVLNVTNKNALVMLTNPADAIGLRIVLVQVEAEYQGKPCKAVRIRKLAAAGETTPQPKSAPKAAKREPPKPDDDMGGDSIQY